jgi:hypothetical protein
MTDDTRPQETKMAEAEIDELRQTVERTYGGKASLAQSVSLSESIEGVLAWEGVVYVFDMEHCPTTKRVYAWSSPSKGNPARRYFTAQHTDAINSPAGAVRAVIAEEHRPRKGKAK